MTQSVESGSTLTVGATETLAVNSELNNSGTVENSGTVALTGGLSQAGDAGGVAVPGGAGQSLRSSAGRRRASATVSGAILPGVFIRTESLTAQLRPASVSVSATTVSFTTDATPDVLTTALAERGETEVDRRRAFGGVVEHVSTDGRTSARVSPDSETRQAIGSFDGFVTGFSSAQSAPEFESVSVDVTRVKTLSADAPTVKAGAEFTLSRVNRAGAVGFETEAVRGAEREGDGLRLSLRVSPSQAAAVISLFPTVEGAVERQTVDGDSFYSDTTGGDLRVSLDSPTTADDGLSGEWVVSDWELSLVGVGSRPWEGSIQLQRPR
jgi:hypothetical protein